MWSITMGAFGVSLLLALLLVPVVKALAHRLDFVDHPSERKIHVRVTPLLGGLAVYSAAFAYQSVSGAMSGKAVALLVACAAAAVLGMVDDRFDIQSRFRLAVHFLLALLLAWSGFRTELLPYGLDIAFSALWITGMINALNCLDCADGIVGGMSALILLSYGVLLALSDHLQLALICFAFAGACIGFLAYNFPPASIFLGDCGSTALGLLIGAVSLRAAAHAYRPALAWYALLPTLLPVGDIILVHVRRYLSGTRSLRDLLASTGKDHQPHRLMQMGLPARGVAGVVYALTGLFCAAALLARIQPAFADAILAAAVAVAFLIEYVYLTRRRAEAVKINRPPAHTPTAAISARE